MNLFKIKETFDKLNGAFQSFFKDMKYILVIILVFIVIVLGIKNYNKIISFCTPASVSDTTNINVLINSNATMQLNLDSGLQQQIRHDSAMGDSDIYNRFNEITR